jgi:hypothetical protein
MINIIVLTPLSTVETLREKLEAGTLTPEQQQAIAQRVDVVYCQPVINGEVHIAYDMLIDSVDDTQLFSDIDWQLIGAWDFDSGNLVTAFNVDLYLKIMPDEIETDEEGNVISRTRPIVPREIHRRAGQTPRQI